MQVAQAEHLRQHLRWVNMPPAAQAELLRQSETSRATKARQRQDRRRGSTVAGGGGGMGGQGNGGVLVGFGHQVAKSPPAR